MHMGNRALKNTTEIEENQLKNQTVNPFLIISSLLPYTKKK